ncbi:phage tail-collar fiber domain-containing protein [Citrobacter portucalensis]|uniref:phage tail-collar fiber domain-containing protein n=1 Tax=Citrobacter portucalensis TaxID=1639133 RepID=UPI002B24639B|nr:phage tail protein [Citrobacter portucalensis]MEB1054813.1 phage tail protein [Citrobacter portucalensis]
MSTKFKTIITTAGAEKLAAATVPGGKKVNITVMAVGDGGGTLPEPNAGQTKLINEVWRHALNKISQDSRNSNYIVAELVIPPEVGGFWMRELGLYDDEGALIAVANMAESYKPKLAEGSGRAQTCRMVIIVSSIASVELSIDATTVMATQEYVDDKLAEHERSRNHPDATLKEKGFVQLSSATDSTSEALAATPKAVKAAYDLASGKYTAQDATTAQKGIVKLSSATDSTSETLAATPKAVKAAYDLASGKYTAQDATTAQKGIVKLSSDTNSESELLAATPKAVKAANDNANGRVPSGRKVNAKALTGDINITSQDIFNGQAIGIDAGQNLNDFKTAGLYFQGMNVNTSSALNYPENNAGALIVLRSAGITQIYYVYNSSRIWSRSQYSNGGWTPWAREYNTQNKPGASEIGALPITGGTLNGSLGIGVANALGGNSIVLGDNDTGFKQEGDGILNVYANSALVMRFISSLIECLKPLKINGNCIATGEIQAANGAVRLAADGNVYGTMWGGWLRDYLAATFQPKGNFTPAGQAYTKAESDARYVQNIRVSAPQERKFWDGAGWSSNDSAFATSIWMVGGSSNVGGLYVRYVQKNINGTWINVTA